MGSEKGVCAFCGLNALLRESHVLPAFVFRWLRERSGTGHIRKSDEVNRRVQDGLKLPWLCDACEGRFGRYESAFATQVFHPWHGGNNNIAYGDLLLKFCVSVSWRVLKYCRGRFKEAPYTIEQLALMDQAELRWRAFLNDEVPHPGEFEQQLLIVDLIESTTIKDLPNNMNRFMTGPVTLDIVGSNRSVMTFAKLGRFMIFGLIQKGPNRWEGTKVHVREGQLKPGKFTIPAGLIDLFKKKANLVSEAFEAMSPDQQNKVQKHIAENLDSFAASDQFVSIAADARMFGRAAVIRKDSEE